MLHAVSFPVGVFFNVPYVTFQMAVYLFDLMIRLLQDYDDSITYTPASVVG